MQYLALQPLRESARCLEVLRHMCARRELRESIFETHASSKKAYSSRGRLDLNEEVSGGDVVVDNNLDSLYGARHRRPHDRLHLHRAEHNQRSTLLDLLAWLDPHTNHNTRHGGSHGARVTLVGVLLGNSAFASSRLVVHNLDDAGSAVHLKRHIALSSIGEVTDSNELDKDRLAGLDLDRNLLSDMHSLNKSASVHKVSAAPLILELHKLLEDFGVDDVAHEVNLPDAIAILVNKFLPRTVKVERLHLSARPSLELHLAVGERPSLEDLCP
mmetsp:Transcript_41581/g.103901  ORF Transcript_41581/g.103901 Transcript_41581/m.103901 type:complete len:272 (+) Transcript_41581:335-1150(+)